MPFLCLLVFSGIKVPLETDPSAFSWGCDADCRWERRAQVPLMGRLSLDPSASSRMPLLPLRLCWLVLSHESLVCFLQRIDLGLCSGAGGWGSELTI